MEWDCRIPPMIMEIPDKQMVTLNSDGRPLFSYWNFVKISGTKKNMISVDIWYMAMDQHFFFNGAFWGWTSKIHRYDVNYRGSRFWSPVFFLAFRKVIHGVAPVRKSCWIFHETIRGFQTSPWTARFFLLRICVQYTAGNLAISKRWNWSQLLSILSS